MELWTAFIIGLAGSVHCIGMCGPIALALPGGFPSKISLLISRIFYNLGRVLTYMLLGAIGGLIGQSISFSGYQQSLSIALGVLILLTIFLPSKLAASIFPQTLYDSFMNKTKSIWKKHFGKSKYSSLFIIGILNGFLPCGLVYVALAGAAITSDIFQGSLYMATFGMGTFPVMLLTSFAGNLASTKIKKTISKLLPVGGVIVALLLILRGMSLGIPYVSPKFEKTDEGKDKITCCDHASPSDSTSIIDTLDIIE